MPGATGAEDWKQGIKIGMREHITLPQFFIFIFYNPSASEILSTFFLKQFEQTQEMVYSAPR